MMPVFHNFLTSACVEHVLQGLLLVYPILWLYLYRTLLGQRRKKLQPVKQD